MTAADEELSRRHFGDGRAIFLRNWPYAMALFQAAGSPVRGRVGIAPLPGRVGGAASAASSGGAHLGVNRRTRHPAWRRSWFASWRAPPRGRGGGCAAAPPPPPRAPTPTPTARAVLP